MPAFELTIGVNDVTLHRVTEADAPNAAMIFHTLNLTHSSFDVMVSLYPSANRTYDVYINFDEEPTLDSYAYKVEVRQISHLLSSPPK